MSLRLIAIALWVLLAVPSVPAVAQTTASPPQLVSVSETLPWYAQSGTNFSYQFQGSSPGLAGRLTYTGHATLDVLGLDPNSSLGIRTLSTASNLLFPNGSLSDDPLFPSYIQVLPTAFVIPETFAVVAPNYGIDFKYLGNATVPYQGGSALVYTYSVTATTAGQQGTSSIVKYYQVLPSNGLVVAAGVSDSATSSDFNMTLSSLVLPSKTGASGLNFKTPDFAAPGNYIALASVGTENETIRLQTLAAEPNGLFIYEKTAEANGTVLGHQFYVDESLSPFFYPASTAFQNTIHFPVAVGSLETGILEFKGQTSVKTPDGQFNVHSYANQTIGFEAYLDDATGVAVYVELPGGFLALSSSNFLVAATPASQITWLPDLIPIGIVMFVVLLTYLHFRKEPRRPRRR